MTNKLRVFTTIGGYREISFPVSVNLPNSVLEQARKALNLLHLSNPNPGRKYDNDPRFPALQEAHFRLNAGTEIGLRVYVLEDGSLQLVVPREAELLEEIRRLREELANTEKARLELLEEVRRSALTDFGYGELKG